MKRLSLILLCAAALCAQTAKFPTSVAADADLKIAKNRITTTLTATIAASDLGITVGNSTGMVANMLLSIDSEIISICAVNGNLLSVGHSACPNIDGRGFDGTSGASHTAAVSVYAYVNAWHHNALAAEVKAIEANTTIPPATNTADYLAQWNGSNSKTLKNGLPVAAIATASTVAQRNASGEVIAANTVATGLTPMATTTSVLAAQMPALTGDAETSAGAVAVTVKKINGTSLAGLGTGILMNTTGTGVPSIATASDFPTLNQSTSGNAASLSAVLVATKGGTGVANTATLTLGTSNVNLATLGTGIVKNTTTTGALTVASAGDFPTLNQNTTGTAAALAANQGTTTTVLHGNASGTPAFAAVTASDFGVQNANKVLSGPATGADATPTFRILASADIPNNAADTTGAAASQAANSQVLTNKAVDVEGTGNSITTVEKAWWPAATCNNVTAILLWDVLTTLPAVAACVTGTNTQKGPADFADGTDTLSMQKTLLLPSDWSGAIDAKFLWFSATTTGSVVWQIATICVADAETDDPAFNTVSTVTDLTKGSANQLNTAAITGVTATGCASGELMHVKVLRDPTHASDDHIATARLVGVELTLRRTQ